MGGQRAAAAAATRRATAARCTSVEHLVERVDVRAQRHLDRPGARRPRRAPASCRAAPSGPRRTVSLQPAGGDRVDDAEVLADDLGQRRRLDRQPARGRPAGSRRSRSRTPSAATDCSASGRSCGRGSPGRRAAPSSSSASRVAARACARLGRAAPAGRRAPPAGTRRAAGRSTGAAATSRSPRRLALARADRGDAPAGSGWA